MVSTLANSVVHMDSTSSSFAALIRVRSLSAYGSRSALRCPTSCADLRDPVLRLLILTVMSISSSARMRAAYDVASSEVDMVASDDVSWADNVVDRCEVQKQLDGILTFWLFTLWFQG